MKPSSLSIELGDSDMYDDTNNNNNNTIIIMDQPNSNQQHQYHCALPGVMRRLALFVDGMTRAMILPFGPSLVHRLVYKSNSNDDNMIQLITAETWSGVAYYLAWVVSVYIVGRWLGSTLLSSFAVPSPDRLPVYVARLGGAALSLHIFTYGAGLAAVKWLVAIRFLSAILAGLLCGLTSGIALPEDNWIYNYYQKQHWYSQGKTAAAPTLEEERVDALRRREGYVDIASGTARIYLTGFAVSILSGGLLFRTVTKDSTFRKLTSTYQYSVSPLFLVGVAVTTELTLRCLFALARNPYAKEDAGTAGRVRGVVRRMVSDNVTGNKTGRDVVVAVESLTGGKRVCMSPAPSFHPLIEEADDDNSAMSDLYSVRYFDADNATRSRVGSFTSIDEFFDCRSMASGGGGSGGDIEEARHMATPVFFDETEVARYVDGKCQYADGSPAFVPSGDCVRTVPENYLTFYNNNYERARRAWYETQLWRREQRVWKIHTQPNTWFLKIKEAYPHFVHGHSKAGFPIIYEQPGRMNLKALFRNGCEIADMVKHYIFFMEYIANHVCICPEIQQLASENSTGAPNSSSWGTMVVMDVKGAGLSHLSGDVVKYLKNAGDINSAHYPNTMKRAFLVNSPFWLAGAWSGLKGILPESVQVDILSESKYLDSLRLYIDNDQIPQEYGGASPYPLGEHPYEVALRKLVDDVKDISEDEDIPAALPPKIEFTAVQHREGGMSDVRDSLSPTRTKAVFEPTIAAVRTPPLHPVRRRLGSVDRESRRKSVDFDPTPTKAATASFSGQRDVFVIVSVMHVLWSFSQGGIEVAVPLWILSPTIMGGLGYSPSRSGVSLFCACLVLMWTLRTKPSKLVSKIPSKSPLRAFRIGVGSESALLALLACVSTFSS